MNWSRIIVTWALFLLTEGCVLFKERIYEYPLPGTDRTLVAYRIPSGVLNERFELRLISGKKKIVLEKSDADSFVTMRCAAAVVSPNKRHVTYLVAVAMPGVFIGAYDLVNEKKLAEEHIDREALRQEIARLYRGLPGFPDDNSVDLIKWATDLNSCVEAFQARFPYPRP